MDNYLDKNRFKNYFLVMANAEANQLVSIANILSLLHLKDGMVRMKFQDEVRDFANLQLNTISSTTSDDQFQECIQNLKKESHNLSIQDRMLRTGQATISSSIKFYHDNEKIIGYVIDGIGVVLGTLQMVAGVGVFAGSLATGNVLGMLAGSALVANGAGSAVESIDKLRGIPNPSNPVKEAYEDTAEFFGFDPRLGLLAYQVVDLTTSYYGIFKLTLKPETWRLFKYLPTDYYRKVQVMSKPALALKGVGAAVKGAGIGVNLYQMNDKNQSN
ncbi:DUF4225 domain-containing protein [Erwinia pyrifoliae]|uniref:DUF4225 domain-containing protein n=1 Tax=Erwinia pyrifoliae TaxID=79967 RepID=UPI000CDC3E47|nr:DUF4225 domain-containing protein [Erwinia pyrifoliae]AUX71777.1 hypothetical protein CPI84_04315 [Erwinia pyrifoliae]MCA8877990.1 DUF4225 domain-containing protein [Erwinia pyrifoliae]